ncbi:5'-methylthioadenosine/adenosylhomocysteine nucleosidase [Sutcliffiella rhizosphaerae]|uniref:adenosylhomocysteine nucleosidase n=1 Tax=Sutcliffiella rhizosphaerae TaxID=2880967 RepID=A0ABM8YTB3_9BACI|nr:5'-methylthioadenosine/adenosylhomocysteine nucleosidase [Sutcliffiella rhizosphaerae]CAG9623026.1 Aminodeoxyfutalosine nucleosidase [Sutcliffiella rhizosphaerae]
MKKIGIIGAMQIEIDLVLEKMVVFEESRIAGFPFYTGLLNEKEIVLTLCGVGKVNSAACTQILIDKFNINYIINTGIAGSLNEEVGISDIVISTDVTHHDVRKAQMKNLFPFQETFIASEELRNLAIKVCEFKNLKYHTGRIVSGECFVEDNMIKGNLVKDYSPACVEMEGSSVGHVSFINDIPFLILRCISDNADENASEAYTDFEEFAGNQSASVVFEMIKII